MKLSKTLLKSFKKAPFKTLIPGLVGMILLMLENLLLLHTKQLESDLQFSQQSSPSSIRPLYDTIKGAGHTILGSYKNYFAFMLMMLSINISMELVKLFINKDFSFWSCSKRQPAKRILISLIKSTLVYSLMYCLYQMIWWCTALKTLSPNLIQAEPLLNQQRYLAQEFSDDYVSSENPQRPSLSIGKVLSEIDLDGNRIILTKNEMIAFVVGFQAPTFLTIIDISDLEFPRILSSYQVSQEQSYTNKMSQAMVLSPDETKLFIKSADSLEVLDVSDLRSPFTLNFVKDETSESLESTAFGVSNALISKDKQLLFTSGLGLQIFDISEPEAPVSVNSLQSRFIEGILVPTSFALSSDGKTFFYTDGSFWIYDVSDPTNMKTIRSFNAGFTISSMKLSRDGKTCYLTGRSKENQLLLQKIYLSENDFTIKEDRVIQLMRKIDHEPVFLEQAPNDVFLFIKVNSERIEKESNVVVFDTKEERVIAHERMFTNNAYSILFSEDYQNIFLIASNRRLKIVNLYRDFPNKNSFSPSKSMIQTFYTNDKLTSLPFATTNQTGSYWITSSSSNGVYALSMHKILSESSPQPVKTTLYQIKSKITKMKFSQDHKRGYLVVASKTVCILDTSDPDNFVKIGEYQPDEGMTLYSFIVSQDGTTGYLSYKCEDSEDKIVYNSLQIVDLSNPKKPVKRYSIEIEQEFGILKLSKDERKLFIGGQSLTIYDVTAPESPVLLKYFPLMAPGLSQGSTEMTLSNDENIIFLKTERDLNPILIQAFDIRNLAAPKLLGEFRFPSGTTNSFGMALSPDSKTIHFMREDFLIAIDVSNPTSIRYAGGIATMEDNSKDFVADFKLSKDGRKAYIATSQGKLNVVGMQPAYSIYLLQDKLFLGERYYIDLMMLEMDKNLDYNLISEDYKLTGFFFVEPPSTQKSIFVLKTPPSWVSFDLKTRSLAVEAHRKSDLQTYTTYFSFSKRVPETVFDNSKLKLPTKSQDLIASLISLGYLDNELFLTENFGDAQYFYLPSQYSDLKDDIFNILYQYHFETFNELHIVQSLNITYGKKLKISTTSPAPLKVEIHVKPVGQAQFLSSYYAFLLPSITNNKSTIVLEGYVGDVNMALKEVVLNLGNHDLVSCDGQIIIDDNLNPIRTESIESISKYFNINKKPRLNKSFPYKIQDQANEHRVETGQYFQIKFDQGTFEDDYTPVESLRYKVVLVGKDGSEGPLPDWLAFRDMTLSGTPPEAIFDRDFNLKIIVKNEFQQFKEPFTLHVKISTAYVLKILMRYSPYLLSILTLIIGMNRIYNILGKKWYQHPKDYYLKPGEEVTSQVIFPIFLIAQEIKEAKKIWRHLERESYFTAKNGLLYDKQRFIQKARDCLTRLPKKEKSSLRLYFQGPSSQKLTIDQLIIHDFIIKLINSQRETKAHYEKIKKDWAMCVEWDSQNSFFKINDKKFDNLLTLRNPQSLIKNDEAPLLDGRLQRVNMELLKDAILAYAFKCQSLNSYPQDVQIHVKERRESNFIQRFLKMDLKDCAYSGSGKVGYGIKSKKKFGTIYFCGVVEEDFLNKTIVFQIINSNHKILKELWIYSVDIDEEQLVEGDDQREQIFYSLSECELETRGKEYEAF